MEMRPAFSEVIHALRGLAMLCDKIESIGITSRQESAPSGLYILQINNIQSLLAASLKESCREETRLLSETCLPLHDE